MSNDVPCNVEKILEYLSLEAPGGDALSPDDLDYLGKFDDSGGHIWVWSFTDSYGDQCYAKVELYADSFLIGYGQTPPAGNPL